MQIAINTIVELEYTLSDEAGALIDSSQGKKPLTYLHGAGHLVPGLEQALEGRAVGDEFTVDLSAEQAYGPVTPELRQTLPRENFQDVDEIIPGMQFQAPTESGVHLVTVVEVSEEGITVDGNHPLAGMALSFAIKVLDIREASQEEAEMGLIRKADTNEPGPESSCSTE